MMYAKYLKINITEGTIYIWGGGLYITAPCVVPQVSQGKVILLLRSNDSTIQYPSSSTVVQHGESLTVECQDQYEFPMVNHTPVTCNNGTWTLIPRCEPARCKHMPKYGPISQSPPNIY